MRTLSPALVVGLFLGLVAGAPAQDKPQVLIEKAIKAEGGADKLAKLKTVRAKVKGTMELMGQTVQFTSDALTHLPDKVRNEMRLSVGGQTITMVQVFDGDKGWISTMGQTQELQGALLDDAKESLYVSQVESLVPLLKDRSYTLEGLGETKVDGRAAEGVKVSSKGHKDIKLYFDKETGYLVKSEHRGLDAATQKEVSLESFYSDYRDYGGVKQPSKTVVHNDGNKFMEFTVEDVKYPDKVENTEFAKP